jgi:pyridoxal/pyridoxine/pyridoxamine kinase
MNTRGKRLFKDAVEDSAVTLLTAAQRASRKEQRSAATKDKKARTGGQIVDQVLEAARESPPKSPLRRAVKESFKQFPELKAAKADFSAVDIGDATSSALLQQINKNMEQQFSLVQRAMEATKDAVKAELAAFKSQQAQNLVVPELKDKTLKVVARAAVETMKRDPDSGE